MAIQRISSSWQNWPGAPGVTQMFAQLNTSNQSAVDAVRTFWEAVKGLIPTGLTITVAQSGDTIDETDGKIVGSWAAGTAPLATVGTAAAVYAGNSGAVIHWLTSTVVRGRRVRGRTFIVPLASTAYDNAGSLASTSITTLTNAASALVTAMSGNSLVVWNRPVWAKPKTTPPTLVHAGSFAPVTGSRVPDLAVSLRSRRI